MFKWYPIVSKNEINTFWVCFGGLVLDALENQILALVIPSLIAYFSIGKSEVAMFVGVTLFASATGGWFAGALSDCYGRVKTLQVMIICFVLFTVLMAFVTDYYGLLLLKALQGFCLGGEWAVGAVLMAETIQSGYRGKMMALMQSAWAVGWGLSVVLFSVVYTLVLDTIIWRIMFVVGVLPALLILYLRRYIQEPEREKYKQNGRGRGIFQAVSGIFSPSLLRTTLLGGLLGLGAHGGYYVIMLWLPIFLLEERNFISINSKLYIAIVIIAFWCGCFASSFLLDRIGRRFNIVCFAICCIVTVHFYLFSSLTNTQMLFLGFPLGFFAAGIPASIGTLFNELYPQYYRGAGVGFCYNFGRIISSIFLVWVGYMCLKIPLSAAIGIGASWTYALVVICVLLLPETKGRNLQEIGDSGQVIE